MVNLLLRFRMLLWVVLFYALAGSAPTEAAVLRYALLIGHNQGAAGEPTLRHAESDARRMRDVLVEFGDIRRHRARLLLAPDPEGVRRAYGELEQLIGQELGEEDTALLIVYFSGHADAEAYHLGAERLTARELRGRMSASAAGLRVVITDACRTNPQVQLKGGRPAPPFAVSVEAELPGEGTIYLHAAGPGEVSQESARLKGSLFSHYLISGLRGAADFDKDAKVGLAEAFRYARAHTLRESGRSPMGAQHPTYVYDLSGEAEVILTHLDSRRHTAGFLWAAPGASLMVFGDGPLRPMAAELSPEDARRNIALRPGRYAVRLRDGTGIYEGHVQVLSQQEARVDPASLRRVAYRAHRAKGAKRTNSHELSLGYVFDAKLAPERVSCQGGVMGYGLRRRAFRLGGRLGYCRGQFSTARQQVGVNDWMLVMRAGHGLAWRRLEFTYGAELGLGLLHQQTRYIGERRPGLKIPATELADGQRFTIQTQMGGFGQLQWWWAANVGLETGLGLGLRLYREDYGGKVKPRAHFVVRPRAMLVWRI